MLLEVDFAPNQTDKCWILKSGDFHRGDAWRFRRLYILLRIQAILYCLTEHKVDNSVL